MKKIIGILCIAASVNMYAQENIDNGKKIFMSRCAACHNMKQNLVGPSLKDVHLRRKDEWLTKFITNSQELIQAGDADAVAVFNQFNQTIMPPHLDLKEEDIKSVIDYIKKTSEELGGGATAVTPTTSVATTTTEKKEPVPYSFISSFVWGIFSFIVVVMLLFFYFRIEFNSGAYQKNKS